VLEDALNGLAYEDDKQIVELHAYRYDDKKNPRIEIEVEQVYPVGAKADDK
jgi:Holliday junction resolvase RusA-like endonuclease